MKIDGYSPHGVRHETDSFHVLLSDRVIKFLREEMKSGNQNHVIKIGAILENLRRNGLSGINNSTLFKNEGSFSCGRPGKPDIAVYVAKSFQIRVYGGLMTLGREKVFLFTHPTIKKRNNADPEILRSAAKELGNYEQR